MTILSFSATTSFSLHIGCLLQYSDRIFDSEFIYDIYRSLFHFHFHINNLLFSVSYCVVHVVEPLLEMATTTNTQLTFLNKVIPIFEASYIFSILHV